MNTNHATPNAIAAALAYELCLDDTTAAQLKTALAWLTQAAGDNGDFRTHFTTLYNVLELIEKASDYDM